MLLVEPSETYLNPTKNSHSLALNRHFVASFIMNSHEISMFLDKTHGNPINFPWKSHKIPSNSHKIPIFQILFKAHEIPIFGA